METRVNKKVGLLFHITDGTTHETRKHRQANSSVDACMIHADISCWAQSTVVPC